jgi:mannose-6-phosphate isomerase-like protein (cupin superfamily)
LRRVTSLSAAAERRDKPWGHEIVWARTDRYVGKILHIAAGEALSLQYHERKDETLYLLAGVLELQLGEAGEPLEMTVLEPGRCVHIWPGRRHRLIARTACDVLEVSTPELGDVIRLDDRYGRAGQSEP